MKEQIQVGVFYLLAWPGAEQTWLRCRWRRCSCHMGRRQWHPACRSWPSRHMCMLCPCLHCLASAGQRCMSAAIKYHHAHEHGHFNDGLVHIIVTQHIILFTHPVFKCAIDVQKNERVEKSNPRLSFFSHTSVYQSEVWGDKCDVRMWRLFFNCNFLSW